MGGRFLCYRTLINHILVGAELAARVGGLAALDVPRLFQLIDCGADRVLAFPVDNSQAGKGVVPILRQREHLGQQALCFQAQALVPQMIVAHNGVSLCAFYSKNGHFLHSFRFPGHEKSHNPVKRIAAFICWLTSACTGEKTAAWAVCQTGSLTAETSGFEKSGQSQWFPCFAGSGSPPGWLL